MDTREGKTSTNAAVDEILLKEKLDSVTGGTGWGNGKNQGGGTGPGGD